MRSLLSPFANIQHADEDVRRRGRNTVLIAGGLFVLTLAAGVTTLGTAMQLVSLSVIAVALVLFATSILLARRGNVGPAAAIVLAVCILGVLGALLGTRQISDLPFFFIISILVASVTLRPGQVWIVAAIVTLLLVGVAYPLASQPQIALTPVYVVLRGGLLCFMVALVGTVGAASTQRAIIDVRRAREVAEASARALDMANSSLEGQITERTAALQHALAEVKQRAAQQEELLAQVDSQRSAIRELSVPVLPIDSATLVMPLIGALDSERLAQVQEQALTAIEQSGARRLFLDVTGTLVIDTQVAQGLIRVVDAARLLGTEVVFVGVRPDVAQAIVSLGIDIGMISSYSNLQSARSAYERPSHGIKHRGEARLMQRYKKPE